MHALALVLVLLAAGGLESASAGPVSPKPTTKDAVCPELCADCDLSGACLRCFSGALLVGGACVRCSDQLCSTCGPTPDTCQDCLPWWSSPDTLQEAPVYQDAQGACRICTHSVENGCMQCGPQGRCTRCLEGWLLQPDGACARCLGGPNCVACAPLTLACTECTFMMGLNASGGCVECADQLCFNCTANSSRCQECFVGAYLNGQGRCRPLPDGCEAAAPSGACTRCSEGHVKDLKRPGCLQCPAGCAACRQPGGRETGLQCTSCNSRFILAPNNACVGCPPDCDECRLPPATTGCRYGWEPGCRKPPTPTPICTSCNKLSLIRGRCLRCEDPRCGNCTGDVRRCRPGGCRLPELTINPRTGRCQYPANYTRPATAATAARAAAAARHQAARPGMASSASAHTGRGLLAQAAPAVINGTSAVRRRHPYMASLRLDDADAGYPHFCGGALIHERFVLTAAHCLLDSSDWSGEASALPQVRLGGYETNGPPGSYEARWAKWAAVHPGAYWDGEDMPRSDLALLLLDRPARTRPTLRLPRRRPRPGTWAWALGWGYVDQEATQPSVLQTAALDLLQQANCSRYFPTQNVAGRQQFCAGSPKYFRDTCQGDSGSPLILKRGSHPGDDVVVGITSWGFGCAEGTPGVYSDVAAGLGWIRGAMAHLLREEAAGRIPRLPVSHPA